MKRFLLYGHGGAYNHGAEAIVVSTIRIIREKYKNAHIALSSHFPGQDREFLTDADEFFAPRADIWEREKLAETVPEKERLAREMYAEALDYITPGTVCLSVGGDNFCYPNWHRLTVFQREAARKGAASILWGCSVEPSGITPEMEAALASYTHILARESRTFKALRRLNLNTGVRLLADPAFLLEPKYCGLPEGFRGCTAGINVSPLIARREPAPGLLSLNMRNLINYILTETDMNIALIPHVTMPMDNDYDALRELAESVPVGYGERVWLVGGNLSASELKSVISQCEYLVCARTHASIAAYSSGVPAFVMGYSVKSKGIALDLGMERFVLDISSIDFPRSVLEGFLRLCRESRRVRESLAGIQASVKSLAGKYSEFI